MIIWVVLFGVFFDGKKYVNVYREKEVYPCRFRIIEREAEVFEIVSKMNMK